VYAGDAAPFERARPLLESCLVSELREPPRPVRYRRWLTAAALILLALGTWSVFAVRERQRWAAFVDQLRAQPGIVVVSSGKRDGKFYVEGLRDPMAADPLALAASARFEPAAIEARWEPYQALYPPFVAARAGTLLRPPAGVTLAYRDGVLTASGPASEQWLDDSERLAPAIGGVGRFAYDGPAREVRLQRAIEETSLVFRRGQSTLVPGQERTIQRLHDLFQALDAEMKVRGARAAIEIAGHTDSDGPDSLNLPLSRARADMMLSMLGIDLFEALAFSTVGAGRTRPTTPGRTEAEKELNRRVSLQVRLLDGAGAGNRP
jgi:OOP family OmpA-OmpF porin